MNSLSSPCRSLPCRFGISRVYAIFGQQEESVAAKRNGEEYAKKKVFT